MMKMSSNAFVAFILLLSLLSLVVSEGNQKSYSSYWGKGSFLRRREGIAKRLSNDKFPTEIGEKQIDHRQPYAMINSNIYNRKDGQEFPKLHLYRQPRYWVSEDMINGIMIAIIGNYDADHDISLNQAAFDSVVKKKKTPKKDEVGRGNGEVGRDEDEVGRDEDKVGREEDEVGREGAVDNYEGKAAKKESEKTVKVIYWFS